MGKVVFILMALCAFAAGQNPDGAPTPDNPNQRTTNDGNANQGNSNPGNQGNPNPGNATPDNQGNPNPGNQGNPNPGDPNKPPTDALPPIDDKKCCGRPLRNMKECCDSPSLVSDEDIDKCVAEMSSNSPDDSPVKMAESKGKTDEGKGDDNKGGKQGRGKRDAKKGRKSDGGSAEDKDDKSKENGGSSEDGGRNGKLRGRKGMGHMGRGHHMRNGGQHWGDKFGAIGKRFNPRAMSCVFKKKEFFDKDGKVDQKKMTTAFVDKVNKDWKPVVQSALTACFADLEAAGKKNGHSAQNGNDFSAKQLVLCVRSKMAQNCPAAAEKKSQSVDCVKSKAELEACDPFHIPSRRGFGDMMRRFEGRKNRGQGQKMMEGMGSNGMGGGEMSGGMSGGPRGGMGGGNQGGMGGQGMGMQGMGIQGMGGQGMGMQGMGGQGMGGQGMGMQGTGGQGMGIQGMGGQGMGGKGMGGGNQGGMGGQGMGIQGMGTQSGKASKKGPEMSAKKKGGKTGKVAKEMGDKNGKGSKKMNNKEKGNSQKAGKTNGKSEKKS